MNCYSCKSNTTKGLDMDNYAKTIELLDVLDAQYDKLTRGTVGLSIPAQQLAVEIAGIRAQLALVDAVQASERVIFPPIVVRPVPAGGDPCSPPSPGDE